MIAKFTMMPLEPYRSYPACMATINQIRQKIHDRDYYLSSHAEDEMVDDYLERQDVEHAILCDRIEKTMTHDQRCTRYRIEGSTMDGRLIHVICRFRDEGSLIIITVYALTEDK
ncbi:MAG: DUF4258 domain-containing protein [Tildeniella nuda ZEHNDER 1965/U140]|nr:DUF4258 domain-containing protein [Tildeniella nuda ZEHNDER 1965/U140]